MSFVLILGFRFLSHDSSGALHKNRIEDIPPDAVATTT